MVQKPSFEPHVLRGEQRGAPPVEPLTWLLGGEVGEADAVVVGQPGLHDGVGLGRAVGGLLYAHSALMAASH